MKARKGARRQVKERPKVPMQLAGLDSIETERKR